MMTVALRVLYVDDESDLLEIGKLFLEASGDFSVATSESAPAALALLKKERFDAIISDYQMPGMDGIQFLVEVRKNFDKIPFILFTGRGREEIVIQAINKGVDFYLQKGGEPQSQFAELANNIKKAVEVRRGDEAIRTQQTELEMQAVELRRSKIALEESRDKYLDLYDFAPLGYLMLSDKGLITEVNLTGAMLIGDVRSRLIGAPLRKFIAETDSDQWYQYFANVLKQEDKQTCTLTLRRGNGSMFPARLESIRIPGSSDKTPTIRVAFSDISDIRKAEEALQKSEEKSRLTLDATNDGIWDWNIPTGNVIFSPRWYSMIGYEHGELPDTYATWRSLLHPDDLSPVEHKLQDHIRQKGGSYSAEFRMRTKQGGWKWIFSRGKVVERDAAGSPVRMVGTHTDIDERKQIEEELAFKNIILSTQQETSLDGIFVVDENGKILSYNRQFIRLWDIPEDVIASGSDELALKTVIEKLTDPEAFLARVNYLYTHMEEKSHDEILLKDGRVLDRYSAPMYSEGKKYSGRVWYFRNVTERKRAEEVIKDAKDYAEKLIQTANAMIIGLDSNGKIITFNEAAEQITGYTAADMAGRNWFEVIVPKERYPEVWEEFNRLLVGGLPEHFENPILTKSGEERYIVWKNSEIRTKGQISGIIGFGIDITERKQVEREMEIKNEKLRHNLDELTRQELALRESEERYRAVADFTYDWEYWIAPDGKFIYVSQSCERITGYRPEEFMLDPNLMVNITHPDDRAGIIEHLAIVKNRSEEHGVLEFRIIAKNGEERWIGHECQPIYNANREYLGNRGSNRDITNRKRIELELERKNLELLASYEQMSASEEELRANLDELTRQEQAMRESEARLLLTLDVGKAGLWEWNPETNEVRFDARFHALLGYAPGELPTTLKEWMPYHNQEDVPVWMAKAEAYMRGDSPVYESEHRILNKSGDWNWVFTRGRFAEPPVPGSPRWFIGFAINVTERRRAEEVLERMRNTLVEAQKIAHLGSFEYITATQTTVWSEEEYRIYGLDPAGPSPDYEEMNKKCIYPDDAALLHETFTTAMQNRSIYELEHRIVRPDGSVRWVYDRAHPYFANDGVLIRYIGTTLDITERKLADKALQESEDRFRGIFDTITSGVAIYEVKNDGASGKDYIIKDFNRTALLIEGKKKEEVIGKSLSDLRPAIDEYGLIPVFQQVWKTGVPGYFPQKVYIDEKYSSWYENRVFRLQSGEIVAVYDDITVRKRAEEALQKSEQDLKEAQAIARLGRWELDLVQNTLHWSDGIYKLFEINPVEFGATYEAFLNCIHPDDRDGVNAAYIDSLKTKKPYEISHRLLMKDGRIKWVNEICRTEYDSKGQPLRSVGIVQEITEIKLAEENLKASEEKYRLLFTSMIDGFALLEMIYDEAGKPLDVRYIDVNPAHEKLSGLKREAIIGRTARESIPGLEDYWIEIYGRVDKSGIPEYFENYAAGLNRWFGVSVYRTSPGFLVVTFENITERRKAETALKESETRLRFLVSSTPVTIYTALASGDFDATFVSENIREILGYEPDEFTKEPGFWQQNIHPDDVPRVNYGLLQLFDTDHYDHEYRFRHKDGTWRWMRDDLRLIRNDDGTPQEIIGSWSDITKRKLTEEKLLELQSAVDQAFDGIAIADPKGYITFANLSWAKMHGYSRDELTGRHLSMFHTKEQMELEVIPFNNEVKTKGAWEGEVRHLRKDGTVFACWMSAVVLQNDNGVTTGLIGMARDITERKVAEQELQLAQQKLKEAHQLAHIGTWDWVIENDKVTWSEELCNIAGWDPLIPAPSYAELSHVYTPASWDILSSNVTRALTTGEPYNLELVLVRPDGSKRWGNTIGGVKRDADGKITGLYGTVQDITQRKIVEEALREREKEYRNLVELASEGVWHLDKNFLTVYVNPAMEEMLGYSKEEMCGRSWYDFGDPKWVERAKELEKRRESGIKEPHEFLFIHKDGRKVLTRIATTPLYDKDGNFNGAIGVLSDITRLKDAEEAVLAAVKLNQLIDSLSVEESMGYTLDEAERCTNSKIGFFHRVNPDEETLQLVTWSTETKKHCYISKEPERNYPVSTAGVWVDCLRERRPVIHNDYASLHNKKGMPEGHVPVIRELAVPLFSGDKIVAIIGVGNKDTDYDERDINVLTLLAKNTWTLIQRKKAEESLKETKDYLENLISYANAPIIVWNPDFEITRFNHAFEELTGRTEIEVTGKRLEILFPTESCNVSMELIQKAHSGEQWKVVEIPILHAITGEVRIVLWNSANILTPDGTKVLATIAQGQDITERKELEKEMEYHEQELRTFSTSLATANKKLTLLSSITRHDINNQMTALRGFTTLLQRKQPDPSFAEYFTKINAAAERISAMIQFTREYDSIGVNAPVWQDCRIIVDNAAKDAPLGKIIVKNDFPAGAEVFADTLIVKVFYNLMDNAVRYGKKITTLRFSVQETGEDHIIICEDDGVGVFFEDKEKIFERGFGKNTGLGLFLSREILGISAITIKETGEPGKGARFEMVVPKGMWRLNPVGVYGKSGE